MFAICVPIVINTNYNCFITTKTTYSSFSLLRLIATRARVLRLFLSRKFASFATILKHKLFGYPKLYSEFYLEFDYLKRDTFYIQCC